MPTSQVDALQHPQGKGDDQHSAALLVIDARSNQWEPLSTHIPDNTDLLLIDENQSGLEQVESSVRFAQSNGIAYEAVAWWLVEVRQERCALVATILQRMRLGLERNN